MLGLAGKSVAQAAVLRGDARGAGVLLAIALHKAAHGDKRHGGEAELLGAKQTGNGNVGAVHKLAVRLQHHAGAQAVLHQRLLGLGKAELKRQARMPNGVARRGAGASVVAADQDLVGSALGHAGSDGAHAGLADQLDADARAGIGALEVKDKLCQVLDGVDVVVGWGRDEADTGGRTAHLGDPGIYLLAGQVAALAGLGALCHLDLDFRGACKVAAGDAKASVRHLLDGGVLGIAVG